MLATINKAIGAAIGAAAGYLVSKGLPAEFATPEIQLGITTAVVGIVAGIVTYFFPANKNPA